MNRRSIIKLPLIGLSLTPFVSSIAAKPKLEPGAPPWYILEWEEMVLLDHDPNAVNKLRKLTPALEYLRSIEAEVIGIREDGFTGFVAAKLRMPGFREALTLKHQWIPYLSRAPWPMERAFKEFYIRREGEQVVFEKPFRVSWTKESGPISWDYEQTQKPKRIPNYGELCSYLSTQPAIVVVGLKDSVDSFTHWELERYFDSLGEAEDYLLAVEMRRVPEGGYNMGTLRLDNLLKRTTIHAGQ